MKFLPQHSFLGQLDFYEIFVTYDGPKIFSSVNKAGNIYLVFWADEEDDFQTWLLVQLSPERYRRVRGGFETLRNAFLGAEDGFVVQAIDRPGVEWEVSPLPVGEIDLECLPHPDESLDMSEEHLSEDLQAIKDQAVERRREVVELALLVPGFRIPAKRLSYVLGSFQTTIDAIGYTKAEQDVANKGRIPNYITQQTAMAVSGTKAGSFKVELEAYEGGNLLLDSLIGDSIEEFWNLLQLSERPAELRNRLIMLKKRTAKGFQSFLKALTVDTLDLRFNWGSPKDGRGGTALLTAQVAKIAEQAIADIERDIEDDTISVTGYLVQGDIPRSTFRIENDEGTYSGKISDALGGEVLHLTMLYDVKLRRVIETTAIDQREVFELIEADVVPPHRYPNRPSKKPENE